MKALILAAGRGSRMGSLTDIQPKCMTVLAGRPLLDWQVKALREAGFADIGIVTGYKAEVLQPCGLQLFHNPRWADTNMVMSLTSAVEWLQAGPCIVSYSDIFYSPGIVRKLMTSTNDIAITYDRDWLSLWQTRFEDPLSDAETFRLDNSGYLTEIGQRAQSLDEIQGQFMGLLKFSPPGWALVEALLGQTASEACDKLDMTGLLSRLIESGVKVDAVPVDGGWGEIDSQIDLEACERFRDEGAYPWMS